MAISYTSLLQVYIDANLYFISRNGGGLTLALFPAISRGRWPWFVANYSSFREGFINFVNGNEVLEETFEVIEKFVKGYRLGNTKINPFDSEQNLARFRPFFELLDLQALKLTPDEFNVRNEELERAAKLEEVDFRNMLSLLKQRQRTLENDIGLGDPTVNELFGITSTKKKRSARLQDLEDLSTFSQAYNFIEGFIFERQLSQKKPPNLLAIASGNTTEESGFSPEDIYETYFPVPFEISLESMALKYLGSVDKWFDLVTINNLQPPFVDEVGTKYNMITNGALNSAVVSADMRESVAPGIRVSIGSFRFREESRIIERVVFNDDNTMVLYLSGSPDLGRFTTNDTSYVRIYKPGTVRSQSIILIPSTLASADQAPSKPTPSSDQIRRLEKAFIDFGVDISRDESTNDIVFDASGNFKLSFGIKAVRQAVRNTLRTNIRELPFHPQLGINYSLGQTYLGSVDEAVRIGDLIRTGIVGDARIDDAKISRISSTKNGASLQMLVKIKGLDDPIQLAFVT